jgi:hypothetical protein
MRTQIAEALLLGESFTSDEWNETNTWSSVVDMVEFGFFEVKHFGVRRTDGSYVFERYCVTQKGKDLLL